METENFKKREQYLIKYMARQIQAMEEAKKSFIDDFMKDPLRTLEWSEGFIELAGTHASWVAMERQIIELAKLPQEDHEAWWVSWIDVLQYLILREAESNESSTSQVSNIAKKARLMGRARVLREVKEILNFSPSGQPR